MPIYVFRCQVCGFEKEVMQAYSAAAPVCTICGRCPPQMERVPARTSWQRGDGPKESNVSRAIRNVKARGL